MADAKVLGEALVSHADMFVTGDAALLRLAEIGALRIVSPRRFWEILRAGPGKTGATRLRYLHNAGHS